MITTTKTAKRHEIGSNNDNNNNKNEQTDSKKMECKKQ
jgi:hypothetical protein